MELAETPLQKEKPFSPAEFAADQLAELVDVRILPHNINIERKPLEDNPKIIAGLPAHEVRRIIDRVKLVQLEIVRKTAINALKKKQWIDQTYERDLVGRRHNPRSKSLDNRLFARIDQGFKGLQMREWTKGIQTTFGLPEHTSSVEIEAYLSQIGQQATDTQRKIVDEYVPEAPDQSKDARIKMEVNESVRWLRRSVMGDFLFIPSPKGFKGLFTTDGEGNIPLDSLVAKKFSTNRQVHGNTGRVLYYGSSNKR